ncbi:MAG: hypothetical protein MI892_11640, partial [Desulfobacterales bacterium]|nr:hypothetical protein [Desulfobacterales bacterium]
MNYEQDSLTQWHFRHDALEAFNSFSAARNLFFWITVAGLVIVQFVFFMVDRGAIDATLGGPEGNSIEIRNSMPGGSINTQTYPEGFILCSYDPYYSYCQDGELAPYESGERPERVSEKKSKDMVIPEELEKASSPISPENA